MSSAPTLPKNATRAPSAAATAQVFATEPPDAVTPPAIAAVSCVAVSASISDMPPLDILRRLKKLSSVGSK